MDDDALSCRSKEGKMANMMMNVLPPSLLQNPVKKPVKFEIFWEKDEIDHEMKEKEEKERKEREEAERHLHAATAAAAAGMCKQTYFSIGFLHVCYKDCQSYYYLFFYFVLR